MVKINYPHRDRERKRRREHRGLPEVLNPIAREQWGEEFQAVETLQEVWISRHFTVQIYALDVDPEKSGSEQPMERLTITHTGLSTAEKASAITRDELMDLKLQCGRGGQWAIEVYPDLDRGVSVPEARHLFIYYGRPEFC